MKPEVVKIFNDLDNLLDFCRLELLPYNPADLYNRESHVWRSFEASRRPRKQYQSNGNFKSKRYNGERFSR